MTYLIITLVSIFILIIFIAITSIKNSNQIASNVHQNIDQYKQLSRQKENNNRLLSELRIKFLEAQRNGVDRISLINEIKKELEKYIQKYGEDDSGEDDLSTY